jgi:hypothetical protein
MAIPSAPARWFYVQAGRRHGPVDLSVLMEIVLTRPAGEDMLVWRAGLPAWVPAREVVEIAPELPPPLPGDERQARLPLEDEQGIPPLPEEATAVAGPNVAMDPVEAAAAASGTGTRKRRHRRKPRGKSLFGNPAVWIPLVAVLALLVLGLWWVLKHVNEVPPGRIVM